jgi:hypoxanthine phosphoribosyltransferase
MTAKIRCEYISWSRFYSLSRILARRIHDSGFKPDVIVAIGRGGYMPARIISDFLHIMNLSSFKIEHYQGTRKNPVPLIKYPLGRGVSGEKVLLVDDVCDSGGTFELADRHLEEQMQLKEARTAVIHFKKTSSFIPDYYAGRIIKWRWIIYPWAAAEDISEFIKEIRPRPETIREIKDILARDHGVRIPSRVLEDILAMEQT